MAYFLHWLSLLESPAWFLLSCSVCTECSIFASASSSTCNILKTVFVTSALQDCITDHSPWNRYAPSQEHSVGGDTATSALLNETIASYLDVSKGREKRDLPSFT